MWCKRQEGDVWGCSAEVCNEAGNVKFECDFLSFIYLFIFYNFATQVSKSHCKIGV